MQNKHKASRTKEIRAEINETKNRKTTEKINESRRLLLKRLIDKIHKILARPIQKRKRRNKLSTLGIKQDIWAITTDTTDNKRIIRECYE